MASGEFIFVKKFRSAPGRYFSEYTTKEPFLCLALGEVGKVSPSDEEMVKRILDKGFVRTDDIAKALGEKAFAKLSKFLIKKYNKKKAARK